MKKKVLILLSILVLSLGLWGCGTEEKQEDNKISIVVSINPLKEFTEVIGGDKVQVKTLVPDGVEPHDFDPNPRDLESLSKSRVFIYNGLGMETWLDKVTKGLDENNTLIIDSSNETKTIPIEDDGHGHDEHEHTGGYDPHIWLSLREVVTQGRNIKDALIKVDPENSTYYEENYNKFKKELEDLDKEYTEKFNTISNKNFITGHSAFGYLGRDYGLKTKSLTNVFSEGEPNPKDLENLVKFCKENNVKTIFSEQASTSVQADTLARDAGAKVEKIYSLETKVEGKTYLEGMKYNLEKIYEALKS
ncbi:MAG: metal ABC transporter solute-binding protein, Zn/Mn family [Clostridium sp.]